MKTKTLNRNEEWELLPYLFHDLNAWFLTALLESKNPSLCGIEPWRLILVWTFYRRHKDQP